LIKTDKDNLETWKIQIPLAVLPQTFADAVKITRAMNIQYLWIDSLCIVQDDMDDWQNEAALMATIYRNSYLTIAATASKDSSGGCFRPRKPFALVPAEVEPTQHSHPSEASIFHVDSMHTVIGMLHAPLNKRGWTFQETALSCRTLHFCEDQLLWHCLERTSTEDGTIDFPGYNTSDTSDKLYVPKLGTKLGLYSNFSDAEFQRIYWWNVVKEFTSRNLTEITDRLPALSGVITELQERTGNRPIGGLWENDLPYGLLWQCLSRAMKKPLALSKVPTWSWVSLDGPIRNHLTYHADQMKAFEEERRSAIETQVEIITVDVFHSGAFTTSPITGGKILLYGRLQSAVRSKEDKDFRLLTQIRDLDISYFRLLSSHPSTDPDTKDCHIGWCTFDEVAPYPDQVLWCLEISISMRESVDSLDPFEEITAPARTHDVLILKPEVGSPGTFRRIGVGVIHAGTETFKGEKRPVIIV
jgi:hypothetical protein